MIVITGYTDPFITKSIAKAIGWKVKATNISHEVQESPLALEKAGLSRVVGFYELSRMNAADRKHYLTKRGIRRSSKAIFDCLDLSLSDSPLRDISLFDNRELEQLKLIDLSWCALTQDDFQQLISRIESLNRRDLKIIISGTESWLDYLDVDSLKGKYVFIERTDFQPNHVNVFTQSETRLLKLFKEPPYRNSELFKQKLKKEDELDAVCHSLEDFINTLYEIKDKEQPPFDIAEPLVMNTLKFYGTAIKKATGFFVTNPLESSTFSLSDTRPFEFDLLKSRLLVTTRKGDRKQFRIKSNAELKVLQKALSNGYSESTLLPKNIEDIPWRILTTEKVYSSSAMVRTYYENHHNFLPAKIFDLINGQESLLRKGKQYGLSVYSFGCGNANDLIGVESLMSSHGIKCNHAIGIDVNPDNFPKAIKKGITLLHGNMQNLESTILPYIQKNDLKIGLFIGSLANQCLPNGMQEAVGILQQAKSMDMIFLSGVTKPLLLKWIAKGMGWHFNGSTSDIDMDESHAKTSNGKMNFNMYVLRAMNNEDRKKYLIKRGTKRTKANAFHCLDLSMSADPVRDINLFSDDELKAIKQIDLSWSAMNNDELKAISTRICGLNNKELIIIISKTEPWLGKIKDLKQFTFFIREDHDKDKVPTLQPHIARALGVYSSLPGRKTKFQ